MSRRFWAFISGLITLVSFLWGAAPQGVKSQSPVDVLETNVSYTFGGQAIFWARLRSDEAPISVQVFYKSQGDMDTSVGQATLSQDEAVYVLDLTSHPLKAFSEVEYYFGITLPSASIASQPFSFFYEDNRFNWQTLTNSPFIVHWYEGDIAFGQMVLDAAQAGLVKGQLLLNLPSPQKLDIYVYASGTEMQSTIRLGSIRMFAGHASPELGVMVVTLPPGPDQSVEMVRQVPHELMHILLYERLGRESLELPTWFNEGLASYNESQPNSNYYSVLKTAVQQNALIPLKDLCRGFPNDASSSYQSYAQSDSFVRYLKDEYGSSGIENLIHYFTDGLDCERGTQLALGKSLDQLEKSWQLQALRKTASNTALGLITPWFLILVVALFAPLILTLRKLPKNGKD